MGSEMIMLIVAALLIAFIGISYKAGSKFREGVSKAGFEASESLEMLFFALKIIGFIGLEVLFAHLEAQNMSYIMTYRNADDVYWLTFGLALFAMLCGMAYGIESSLQKDRVKVLPSKIEALKINKDKKQEMLDNLAQATAKGKTNIWLLLLFSIGTHVVIGAMATATILNQQDILQGVVNGTIDPNTVNIEGAEMLHYSSSLIFTSWLISLVGFAIDIAIGRFTLATEEMYKFTPKEEHVETAVKLEAKYGIENEEGGARGKQNSSSEKKEEQATKTDDGKKKENKENNEVRKEAKDYYDELVETKKKVDNIEKKIKEEFSQTIFAENLPKVLNGDELGNGFKGNIKVTLDHMLENFKKKDKLKSILAGASAEQAAEIIFEKVNSAQDQDFQKHVKEAISGITQESIGLLKTYKEGAKSKSMLKGGIEKFKNTIDQLLALEASGLDKKFQGAKLNSTREKVNQQLKTLETKVNEVIIVHEDYQRKQTAIQTEMETIFDAVSQLVA